MWQRNRQTASTSLSTTDTFFSMCWVYFLRRAPGFAAADQVCGLRFCTIVNASTDPLSLCYKRCVTFPASLPCTHSNCCCSFAVL